MDADMDNLMAGVERNTDLTASIKQTFQNLSDRLMASAGDKSKVKAIASQLAKNSDQLAEIIQANTDAGADTPTTSDSGTANPEAPPAQDAAGVTGSNAGTATGTGQAGTEAAAGTSGVTGADTGATGADTGADTGATAATGEDSGTGATGAADSSQASPSET